MFLEKTSQSIKDIIKDDPDYSLEDLLREYTGQREPTFLSGMGWAYTTYEDAMNEDIEVDIAYNIVLTELENLAKKHLLSLVDSDESRNDVLDAISDLDVPSFGEDSEYYCLLLEKLLPDNGIRPQDISALDFAKISDSYYPAFVDKDTIDYWDVYKLLTEKHNV